MADSEIILLASAIVIIIFGIMIITESVISKHMRKNNGDAVGKTFWSRYAGIYDRFMKKDAAAYSQMYEMICRQVKGKNVLELATGTGLIAENIVKYAKSVEATDASAEMISEAKKSNTSSKIHFSVQDIFDLPYADKSFPVIIASNVLHIIPDPEKAISEMKRVLDDNGVLILPTFTHADMGAFAHMKAGMMKKAGFPLTHIWSPSTYIEFLKQNGLKVEYSTVIKASFPLTYTECHKKE